MSVAYSSSPDSVVMKTDGDHDHGGADAGCHARVVAGSYAGATGGHSGVVGASGGHARVVAGSHAGATGGHSGVAGASCATPVALGPQVAMAPIAQIGRAHV